MYNNEKIVSSASVKSWDMIRSKLIDNNKLENLCKTSKKNDSFGNKKVIEDNK